MGKSQLLADLAKVVSGARAALSEGGGEVRQHLRSSVTNLLQSADVATKAELEAVQETLKRQGERITELERRLKQSTRK